MPNVYQARIQTIRDIMAMYERELEVLEALDGLPASNVSANGWNKKIDIQPPEGTDARALAMQTIAHLRSKGQPPTIATKHLDASTGKISYEIPGPMPGWTLTVSGGDPRCRVVPVKRLRQVPEKPAVAAVAAHEEEYTEYVIENPEECGAAGGE